MGTPNQTAHRLGWPIRTGIPVGTALASIAAVEVGYWIAVRMAGKYLPNGWGPIELELVRTALRILAASVLVGVLTPWVFLRPVSTLSDAPSRWPIILSSALCLLAPTLTGNLGLSGFFKMLYAGTSIFVGIHEELFWRAFLLIAVARYAPIAVAVIATSLLFSLWHYGMFAPTIWNYAQAFFAGVTFSLLYLRTGNLWLVIMLHTAFDVIVAVTPAIPYPLAPASNTALMLASTLTILGGFRAAECVKPTKPDISTSNLK